MKGKVLSYASTLLFLLCACKKNAPNLDTQGDTSKASIDNHIIRALQSKGEFQWSELSDEMVWSALSQSGQVLSVGYKPANWTNSQVQANMHTIDIASPDWQQARQALLDIIFDKDHKEKADLKMEQLEVWPEKNLPVMCVYVRSLAAVKLLRHSNLVRYAEPIGYKLEEPAQDNWSGERLKSLGCNGAPSFFGALAVDNDYTLVSPMAKASWNYDYHRIRQGWKVSSGKAIKVMMVDTGCSLNQEALNGSFNQGESTQRTIEKLVTLPPPSLFGFNIGSAETPQDLCGHGTEMSGAIAAPRGTRGAACGVAYNCDLITVRAAADVILDEPREAKGVADAFNIAAKRDDVKIISMSMGFPIRVSQIADAVQNALNRGKLIFCAAGTTSKWTNWMWVAFPASMPGVQAVTGIKDDLKKRCDVCHEGDKVAFVVVMEKSNGAQHPLSLAMTGDAPSLVGGSSIATAQMAGMAAVVWSRYPNKSAAEILEILNTSAINPDRNPHWGAGLVQMNKALAID